MVKWSVVTRKTGCSIGGIFMNIFVLNRKEQIIGVVSNEGENNYLSSAVLKEELNKMKTLELEVSTLSPEVEHIKEENYLLFKDVTKKYHLFLVREVSEIHSLDSYKNVYCECASQELLDFTHKKEFMGGAVELQPVLHSILYKTPWQLGRCEDVGSKELPSATSHKNSLELLHMLKDTWGLQLQFRIEVSGNRITGKYVDLVKTIGVDVGKRFEYHKDLIRVERNIDTTNLKTAIMPFGGNIGEDEEEKNLLGITGIEWKKPNNPLDKPLGQDYLEIPEATELWGHLIRSAETGDYIAPRMLYYQNDKLETAEQIINEAYEVLIKRAVPTFNYKLEVVDLFALTGDEELRFESVGLGDIVRVIDNEFNPPIQLKTAIISKETDLLLPENTKVELGSFVRNLVDTENSGSVVGDVQNTFKDILSTGTIKSVDSNIILSLSNGQYKLGGKESDIIALSNDRVKAKHTNGTSTELNTAGLYFTDMEGKQTPYHHITYSGECACPSGQPIRIQLPDEFKGIQFTVIASLKAINTSYDTDNYKAPIISFNVEVLNNNYIDGWTELKAVVSAWDKDTLTGNSIINTELQESVVSPVISYCVIA